MFILMHSMGHLMATTNSFVTFLDFTSPLANSHIQTDSTYFDLSCAFDLHLPAISRHKLRAHGLSDGNVNWFCSYQTNRHSSVRILSSSSSSLTYFTYLLTYLLTYFTYLLYLLTYFTYLLTLLTYLLYLLT
jgi:hypothetical protein